MPVDLNRSKQDCQACRYITTDFFPILQNICVKVSMYESEFNMETALFMQPIIFKQHRSKLPQCFENIPESVSAAFNIDVPDFDTSAVIEVPGNALYSLIHNKIS